jgi:diguanylate cyclase (GGDEF)-like protein/PAS domain S-box-containing protein
VTAPPIVADRRVPGRAALSAPVRDPVLLGLLVIAAALAAVYLVGWGGPMNRIGLFWPVQATLDVAFVALSWRVTRLATLSPASRRFWRVAAVAGGLFAAGDGTQAILTFGGPTRASMGGGTVQTALIGAGALCIVVATLAHPIQATDRERIRLWLDAATIMAGVGVFVWAFSFTGGSIDGLTPMVIALVTAGAMLVCAFGLVKLLLGGNAPFTRRAGVAAGISATFFGVTTGLGTTLADSAHLDLVSLARLLPCLLLAATPRIQELHLRADPAGLAPRRRRPYSRLPYLAVLATQVLLVVTLLGGELTLRVWGIVAGVILITALVVIRQLAAFTDNNDLLLRLRRQEQRFRSLVQHASDITVVADARGSITYASPAVHRVLDRPPELIVGQTLETLVHPQDRPVVRGRMRELDGNPRASVDLRLRARHRDGSWRWLEVICTNLLEDPSVTGIICNARDVTDMLRYQERLTFEATHDPLTGLANRVLLQRRMEGESAGPSAGRPVAVLAIDLDDFKTVNDSLGHHIGDGLLVCVADRLRRCVPKEGTVARLGGDEFAVFLPSTGRSAAAVIARRILAVLAEQVLVEGHELLVYGSVGVATAFGRDANALLRAADAAMYLAKQNGKGTYATAA